MSRAKPGIEWVRSIEFDVTNLEASVAFYEDVWGLATVARAGSTAYLRGTGPEHHLLVLRQGTATARRLNFGVSERRTVDALHAALAPYATSDPETLDEPGGGYGFAFTDPEGRAFRIVAEIERLAPLDRSDAPQKISHALFQSTDPAAASAFFCGTLGFRLRDHAGRNYFLGCNADHHCFGFGQSDRTEISHVAFELPSIDGLMRGVGRMRSKGMTIEWGPGRHGPGNNVFAYFFDPDGFVIEYTCEMEQVGDATYNARTPEFWDKRTTSDVWGIAGPPSERFRNRGPRGREAAGRAVSQAPSH
jgi:catechol 2,3-dioxygenase-like lactoylglutathione lyase family enzyme